MWDCFRIIRKLDGFLKFSETECSLWCLIALTKRSSITDWTSLDKLLSWLLASFFTFLKCDNENISIPSSAFIWRFCRHYQPDISKNEVTLSLFPLFHCLPTWDTSTQAFVFSVFHDGFGSHLPWSFLLWPICFSYYS
jgi:hypothetical protein